MELPVNNIVIPDDKITSYLLIYRNNDDKSKYLAQGGFTRANPEQLKSAILELAANCEAIKDKDNQYGTFYRIKGELKGANNHKLRVITIWLKRKIDDKFQFITLKPNKEKKHHD
jgi:hypothetical protein